MPDPLPLLVTFARPEESVTFRRRLASRHAVPAPASVGGKISQIPVVVAHTGIGPTAAAATMDRLLALQPWWMVAAAGFAGGLDPKLAVGDTILEEHPTDSLPRVISRDLPIESVRAKAALFAETGASCVDMETATLATRAHTAGLPFIAIRAISDPADRDLPIPFPVWFDLARQRPRPLGLLGHLLRHPGRIGPFAQFVRALQPAREALALAVEGWIRALEHP